ncbi:MAG: HPF/RaiA family ribosome-associated protein [Acidimicrobiia bacterium]
MADEPAAPVVMVVRGDVGDDDRMYAERKVDRLRALVHEPLLFARVELTEHGDAARERPSFAKAEVDVNGRMIRAHAAAETMHEAVDAVEARLRERLERASHHAGSERRRARTDDPAEWHHGDASAPRASYFPRPADAREVVRHKTFSFGPMTPEAAAEDLEALDHDFYLFTNDETGEDNVVARSDAGYELLEPPPGSPEGESADGITRSPLHPTAMTIADARAALDLTNRAFVFFLDADDGRGRVLYRRYDGHYGLILPAT